MKSSKTRAAEYARLLDLGFSHKEATKIAYIWHKPLKKKEKTKFTLDKDLEISLKSIVN